MTPKILTRAEFRRLFFVEETHHYYGGRFRPPVQYNVYRRSDERYFGCFDSEELAWKWTADRCGMEAK